MSFLDDLKGVLHFGQAVAPTVATAINPAAGALVGLVVTAVTKAEQAGGTGPAKKAAVLEDILPTAADVVGAALKSRGIAPQVDPGQLSAAVGSMVDGVVALLNAVSAQQPAATVSMPSPPLGPIPLLSSHLNVVTITDNTGTLSEVTYVAGSAKVTQKQPSSTPPVIERLRRSVGNSFVVTLDAGRAASSEIAQEFIGQAGSTHVYAPSSGGSTPKDLNFFFGVDLTFTDASGSATVTVYLGQGSTSSSNNWWIGGPAVAVAKGQATMTYIMGGDNTVLQLGGSTNEFVLS